MVPKCSFRHNLSWAFNQKTSFTKDVKLFGLRKEMPSKPQNMKLFELDKNGSCWLSIPTVAEFLFYILSQQNQENNFFKFRRKIPQLWEY